MQVLDNSTKTAAYPKESPEAWARLRAACEKPDEKKAHVLLIEMDLSPKLFSMFAAAVSEEVELLAVVAAAGGKQTRWDEIKSAATYPHLASTPEEASIYGQQQRVWRDEAAACETALVAAKNAARQVAWLRAFFSELFARPSPPHPGYLSSTIPAPRTFDTLIPFNVSPFARIGAWRSIGAVEDTPAAARRRVYSSFSPVHSKR